MKPDDLVEVIVRPRRRLYGDGGVVHLPGDRLKVSEADFAVLLRRGVVSVATEENVLATEDAIAKGLPIARYVPGDPQDTTDVSDPVAIRRRASSRRASVSTENAKPPARRPAAAPPSSRPSSGARVTAAKVAVFLPS